MKEHALDKLFNPQSIVVIGASNKPLSVGATVFSNLLNSSFLGLVFPVNPKHKTIQGRPCFSSIKAINHPIDLAVIVTPAKTVAQVLIDCGENKIHHVIILSAGFGETGAQGARLEQELVEIARRLDICFIGPNCLGVIRPFIHLNATFENSPVLPGKVAFVSQSGALIAAMLDWAIDARVGFSTLVSLGNHADLDFGDLLDYLAQDKTTDCILLYIEGIRDARSFMRGLQAASRLKPVVVIKAGRNAQGSHAAISHTGAMIGADDVFDAALKRAGVIRVKSVNALFTAAEVFARHSRVCGSRLAIVTNGGGAGVMAADFAADLKIKLPLLSDKTRAVIHAIFPQSGAGQNPVDILGDATPARYQQVVEACLNDDNCDAVLIILVPVAMAQPFEVAKQVIRLSKQTNKPILACWMGQEQVRASWTLFAEHQIPCFSTPEAAIDAFSYLAEYHHNQQRLLQVSEPIVFSSQTEVSAAKQMIERAQADHRHILTMTESKTMLSAFGIPITETHLATQANDAVRLAKAIGFPVAMKISSPDITHKQEVGGVQLNISNAKTVHEVFNQLIARAKQKRPEAQIIGVTVERMYKTANDRELMVGILRDPVFGPVINFGAGGSLVEVMQDRALALPPLNQRLIKNLISRTHIARMLGEFRNQPAVKIAAIEQLLLRVSEMACELPQIQEMDINPLIVNDQGIIAVDARIVITDVAPLPQYEHMAMYPYSNLNKNIKLP